MLRLCGRVLGRIGPDRTHGYVTAAAGAATAPSRGIRAMSAAAKPPEYKDTAENKGDRSGEEPARPAATSQQEEEGRERKQAERGQQDLPRRDEGHGEHRVGHRGSERRTEEEDTALSGSSAPQRQGIGQADSSKDKEKATDEDGVESREEASTRRVGRLPTEFVEPKEEFGRFRLPLLMYLRSRVQASWSRFQYQAQKFFTPRIVVGLSFSAALSFSIGMNEAMHVVCGAPNLLTVMQEPVLLRFCASYSVEQMLASFAMLSVPAETVATAHFIDPNLILANLSIPENAHSALTVKRCESARIMLTQLLTVTQLFRLANLTMRARDDLKRDILSGSRPPKVRGERFIRLCGEVSDMSPRSLSVYTVDNFLPVYENPAAIRPLVNKFSRNGTVAFYWCVRPGAYGKHESWEALVKKSITPRSLIQTNSGRRILYLEADATNSEHGLAFNNTSSDLSVMDAVMGFRLLEQQVQYSIGSYMRDRNIDFNTVRVYLGYPAQEVSSGGGRRRSVRDYLLDDSQADVVIDAHTPLLKEVMEWAKKKADQSFDTICFSTDVPEYFDSMKQLLKPHKIQVVDAEEPAKIARGDMPCMVYHHCTMQTVHVIDTLLRRGIFKPENCVALIDQFDGLEAINLLRNQNKNVDVICSAIVLDDWLGRVRQWVRQDWTPAQIQKELDLEFAKIAEDAREVASGLESTNGEGQDE